MLSSAPSGDLLAAPIWSLLGYCQTPPRGRSVPDWTACSHEGGTSAVFLFATPVPLGTVPGTQYEAPAPWGCLRRTL